MKVDHHYWEEKLYSIELYYCTGQDTSPLTRNGCRHPCIDHGKEEFGEGIWCR
jgi:hypothetical protein